MRPRAYIDHVGGICARPTMARGPFLVEVNSSYNCFKTWRLLSRAFLVSPVCSAEADSLLHQGTRKPVLFAHSLQAEEEELDRDAHASSHAVMT